MTSASYLSDALDELCRAVVEVLCGEPTARASFDEEPGEYRWLLDPVTGGRVRVRVLEFPELWSGRPDEEGRVVLDAECGLRALAGGLVSR